MPKVRKGWAAGAGGSITTEFHEHEDDSTIVSQTQDLRPYLEENKRLYDDADGGWSKSRDMRRAASIPISVYMSWVRKLGVTYQESLSDPDFWNKVLAMLDDPDNRAFRTAPGRLSRKPVRSVQVGYRGGAG